MALLKKMTLSEACQMDKQSDDYLIKATIILNRMVPSQSFSNEMAFIYAGAGHGRALTDLGLKLKIALQFTNKFYGPPSFSMDMQSKKQRYLYFTQIAKIWPSKFFIPCNKINWRI